MEISDAPHGIQYDNRTVLFVEEPAAGHLHLLLSDKNSIRRKKEDSVYQAYFRATRKESTLYVAFGDENGVPHLYRVNDLEAMADSLGIDRQTGHVHNVHWAYSKDDPGSGRYAWLDVEYLCGCQLSRLNSRIMVKQLENMFGWRVIQSSIDSTPSARKTIKVERSSVNELNKNIHGDMKKVVRK